jgi:signal transduction histidine kinase
VVRALEEAQRAADAREWLMRVVTHDLKNPLGAADGYGQLLDAIAARRLPRNHRPAGGRRSAGAPILDGERGSLQDLGAPSG